MKKQRIYFIFLFFVCLLMPSVAMAEFDIDLSDNYPWTIVPGRSKIFTVEVQKDGRPVSGQTVTPNGELTADEFASVSPTSATTDSNGQAQTTLTLTGDTSAYQYVVWAELDNGQSDTNSVSVGVVSDGAELSLAINNLRTYRPGESAGFTFNLSKVEDGTGVSGKTVTFSVSPDDGTASVSPTSATTDSNGEARTKLILGSGASGKYRVTATLDDGTSKSKGIPSVYNPTPLDFFLSMSIPSGAIPLRPGESRTFIAIAEKDLNYVSGKTLTFSVSPDDGTVSLSTTSATTDSNGRASTTLTTGSGSSGSYTVTARGTSSGGRRPSISGTVTVDASLPPVEVSPPEVIVIPTAERAESKSNQNTPPVFSDGASTTRSIAENTASGTGIGSPISATDADIGDTLTYSLSGTDAAAFSIDSSTGQLRTAAALDYETKKVYSLTITATDSSGAKTNIDVTINVTDVNETVTPPSVQQPQSNPQPQPNPQPQSVRQNTPPVFSDGASTTRSIAENTASGIDIGSPISATDADTGDILTYSLSGTDAASFSIDSSTGQLKTAVALDFETKRTYTVTVNVFDGKGGSDKTTVTINVTDINETVTPVQPKSQPDPQGQQSQPDPQAEPQPDPQNTPPVFSDGASTTRSIAENTGSNVNIGSPIAATDPDGDALTWTLSGSDAAAFSIVATSGQLRTVASLDFETKRTYTVTVNVFDGKGGSNSISVTINVTDVNETVTPPLVQQPQPNPQPDPQPQQSQPDPQVVSQAEPQAQQPQPQSKPQPEPNWTLIPFDYEKEGVGRIVFSEIMLSQMNKAVQRDDLPQWIELYNTTNQDIDIKGWKIVGRYLDDSNTMNILESQVISKSLTIKGKETFLIVSYATTNSRDRISIGLADKADALGSNSKNFWNYEGLVLELQDAEGNPVDRIGNLNDQNEIVWEIPSIVRDERVSLIRRLKSTRSQEYNWTFGIKEFGWFPANEVERLANGRSQYYYGRHTDIGSPGYRTEGGEILPVTLSSFNPRINQDGSVVINWRTESEVDNAGFNILRSNTKKGPFVKVNPKLIQGAGTTGERNAYRWIDTAAKPNIEYYYQIEDVSFSGIKQTLATQRLKGIHTAKNRALTSWGIIKQDPNK
ncbi:MAG: cadherin domain-containing protein [Candidatus Poribacteria bacterium]|nr:cadherin domain-containing protein [Candidatus Poribacteria bacterium]